jgi:hypothetical protein
MTAFRGPVNSMRKSSWMEGESTLKSREMKRTTIRAIASFHNSPLNWHF